MSYDCDCEGPYQVQGLPNHHPNCATNQEGKTIQKWSDSAMFTAEPSDATNGPRVYLLSAPADPLGSIAACAKMYSGEVVRDLADVTDDERRHYLGEMQKTKLAMPLESVQFHFILDGVTRAFTHQLVRQRTAAYAQESMRFAVIEDNFLERVALPPSIAGTVQEYLAIESDIQNSSNHGGGWSPEMTNSVRQGKIDRMSREERWRMKWDATVEVIQRGYQELVNDGMPAEDARGLLPTNITTRVHYITNLRALLDHAGNRLCTQAQFEWRTVFAQLAKALREHDGWYDKSTAGYDGNPIPGNQGNGWQYQAISELLKPVCYQQGKCPMKADFDRKCSIRSRVDANAAINRPSSEWHEEKVLMGHVGDHGEYLKSGHIEPISPVEWLADPGAAR